MADYPNAAPRTGQFQSPGVVLEALDSSGNAVPIKVAGDTAGNAKVTITNDTGSSVNVAGMSLDGQAGGFLGLIGAAFAHDSNGTSWDRRRNNVEATLLASAARTATQTSADIITYNASALTVILDVTNVAASPSVTVTINGKDPASGKYYLLLSGAAVITAVTNVYKIQPGGVVAANVSANDRLPRTIQIVVTANNANSGTYSVGYILHV